jgi:hypothetical protein
MKNIHVLPKEEPKQETLEEAAKKLTNDFPALEVRFNMTNEEIYSWFLEALQKGAKWQQERSYSEEDIRNAIDYGANLGLEGNIGNSFEWTRKKDLWFEQFKKK